MRMTFIEPMREQASPHLRQPPEAPLISEASHVLVANVRRLHFILFGQPKAHYLFTFGPATREHAGFHACKPYQLSLG